MIDFVGVSFQKEIASRFKEFSRKNGESYSCTLELMLDFFQKNNLSPNDSLDDLYSRDQNIHQRINNLIAIIREIEKTQTQPTLAILEVLMDHQKSNSQRKSSQQTDHTLTEKPQPLSSTQEKTPEAPIPVNQNYQAIKKDMEYLLEKTSLYRSPFGNPRLHLNISREEFERLKIKLKNY